MDTKILSRLQAQCARREYCRKDIKAKALKALDGDEAAAEEMTQALVRDGFVDDGRYGAAFAREKASISGWGPVKISFALSAKGLSREDIQKALEDIDLHSADTRMEKVLEAKYRALREDPEVRLKMLRFALSRGYNYDQVKDLIDTLIKNEGETEHS